MKKTKQKESYTAPFTILDVAAYLGIEKLEDCQRGYRVKDPKNEANVVCPFCGDARGKASICVCRDGEVKNVFHCYDCGSGYNMVTLYAELKHMKGKDRYKRAYRELYRKKQRQGNGKMRSRRAMQQESQKVKKRASSQKKKMAKPLDKEQVDETYRAMLKYLTLEDVHKKDLVRRGVSEEIINRMVKKGYRSISVEESLTIARRLLKEGCKLEGVPGFFKNWKGEWDINFHEGNRGYLCPVYDIDGFLRGFQIRLDQPKKKNKYVWLSSSGMEKGTSITSLVGVSGTPKGERICLTEGILKAEIASQLLGVCFLGNPGIGNWRDLLEVLKAAKERGVRYVEEMYDMDKMLRLTCQEDYDENCSECEYQEEHGNPDFECPKKRLKRDTIRKGCNAAYRVCRELGLTCERKLWDVGEDGLWDEHEKGIDDWETRDLRKKDKRV